MGFDIDFGALQHANPFAAYEQGQDFRAKIERRKASASAGRKLATGDRAGAIADLGGVGLVDDVRTLQGDERQEASAQAAAEKEARLERAKVLHQTYSGLKRVKPGSRLAALQKAFPLFQAAQVDTSYFDGVTEDQLSDEGLAAFGVEMDKTSPEWREIKNADGSTSFVDLNRAGQPAGAPAPTQVQNPFGGPQGGQGGSPDLDGVFGALVMQESSGRPGVLGPQTKYGRAEGMTQMLPATAQEMARKLGVAWRPELMRGTSPEAAQYQQQLGRAYFDEGLQRYGGDVQKALMYYHGGPDERLWGPKTRSYAQSVLRRTQPFQTASNAPVAQPGVIPGSAAPGPEWVDEPGGGQRNVRTGKREGGPKNDDFDREQKLRSQYGNLPQVKDLASVQAHVRTIGTIARKAANGQKVTAADDMALIFAYMKMLDPGSVVREGEFANAEKAGGIPDRIRNMYNKALNGTRLTDKQRGEFFATATTAMDSYTTGAAAQSGRYRQMAQSYGLNPDRVAENIRAPGPRNQPAAKPPPARGGRPPLTSFQR